MDRFRNSQLSLGEVIQNTLIQRETVWEIPQPILDRPSAQLVAQEKADGEQQRGGSNRTRQQHDGKGSGLSRKLQWRQ